MKKIIFLIAIVLVAIITIRCKEDAEIPALKFDIDASTDKTLTERGLNDNAIIKFDFKTEYDYTTAPLSYKIDYDKQGILKLGDEELKKDTTYKLDKPELTLSYVGKEAKKHTIKVHFFNDKGINILKEIEIPYVKYNFTVAVLGDEAPYQGELKEYKLTITPENATVKDSYKIKFISYDENDPSLQKSYVALNGTKIEFNKVYDIDVTKEQKISLKSFHSGAKNLIYTIINNSSEKQEKISQNIKASEIEVKNLSFNKLTTNTLGDNLQLRGFINKTPTLSKGIQYRTWIVDVPNEQKDGIENTDNTYKDFTLPDNNEFVLNVKVKKYGTYKYMLQFKDEFGTESAPTSFEIKAIDKNFEVEQKVTTNLENVIQGQRVELLFNVKEMEATNEEYQVQFLSFDEKDVNLQKTKISFNNAQIQLNKWYTVKKGEQNLIAITTSYAGSKKLVYQVKNSMYNKTSALEFNVKKATISLSNLSLKTSKSRVLIGETFKVEGTVEKTYPGNKTIEYKTWLSSGNASNFKELTNTYRGYELSQDNMLSLNFKVTSAGNYTLKVQAKDEFGNESEPKEFAIIVKDNEFEIEQISNIDFSKVKQGEEINVTLKVKEEFDTNEIFEIQFLSFGNTDPNLEESEINFNGEKIQLKKWYSFNKKMGNQLKIKGFKSGSKELVYQIKNSAFTKKKSISIDFLQEEFTLNTYCSFKKVIPDKSFNFKLILETKNHNKEVKYFANFNIKVIYKGRIYIEGQDIPIDLEDTNFGNLKKEIDFEGIVNKDMVGNIKVDIYNTDKKVKFKVFDTKIFVPLKIQQINFFGKSWCSEKQYIITWEYTGWDCIKTKYYFMTGTNSFINIDDEMLEGDNKNQVKYVFIIKDNRNNEKRIEVLHKDIYLQRKILEDNVNNGDLSFQDNLDIEVFYKDKKIYEAKNIKGFYQNNSSWNVMQLIRVTDDKIYYENYDHIMK